MQSVIKAQTTLELNEANFEWTVQNWSRKPYLYNELLSQEFQLMEVGKICFFRIDTINDYFCVNLETCAALQNANATVHVLGASNKIMLFSKNTKTFIQHNGKTFISFYYVMNKEHVKDDILTIFCSVKYVLEYCEVKNISRIYKGVEKPYAQMLTLSNYDKLYKDQELCDVTFLIEEEQIKAHIVILAAASSYFLAMFRHEKVVESKKQMVDFSKDTDITSKNFKSFLDCIYGCKSIKDLGEIAYEILILADKFHMNQLQESCELYLTDMLSEKNVAKTLLFAERYGFLILRKNALNLAKININILKESEEFDELCQMKELMRQLL